MLAPRPYGSGGRRRASKSQREHERVACRVIKRAHQPDNLTMPDTVLVHRTPEVVQFTIDFQEHLIEVPGVARLGSPPAELTGEVSPELQAPLSYALVADRDAPLGQEQFHLSEAQAEDVIQPDGVADDLGWEAVSGVGGGLAGHRGSMPQPLCFGQRPRT